VQSERVNNRDRHHLIGHFSPPALPLDASGYGLGSQHVAAILRRLGAAFLDRCEHALVVVVDDPKLSDETLGSLRGELESPFGRLFAEPGVGRRYPLSRPSIGSRSGTRYSSRRRQPLGELRRYLASVGQCPTIGQLLELFVYRQSEFQHDADSHDGQVDGARLGMDVDTSVVGVDTVPGMALQHSRRGCRPGRTRQVTVAGVTLLKH